MAELPVQKEKAPLSERTTPLGPDEPLVGLPPHAVHGPPEPTLLRHLAALWGGLVLSVATPVFATGAVCSYAIWKTPRSYGRWARGWARTLSIGAGMPVHVHFRSEIDTSKPVVYVANHQNAFDIPAMILGMPHDVGFMAKAALQHAPALGFALKYSPSVFVDRSDPRKAVQSLKEAGEKIRGGNAVVIFPEGCRTYSDGLLPFMRGAFLLAVEAGVPIVPVTLLDSYKRLDERHAVLVPGHVHLVVDAPIPLEGKTRQDVPALMDEVYEIMRQNLADAREGKLRLTTKRRKYG